ncbi:MAG: hypothetical protein JWN40_3295 [Phycisphaerales bacterium]|nr:hypothetical protein [Phycisphaerales bacterium]
MELALRNEHAVLCARAGEFIHQDIGRASNDGVSMFSLGGYNMIVQLPEGRIHNIRGRHAGESEPEDHIKTAARLKKLAKSCATA